MKIIPKPDWDRVHELASEIANAYLQKEEVIGESKTEALQNLLEELAGIYGPCSRLTATQADYEDDDGEKIRLYQLASKQAKAENDPENEQLILESLEEMEQEER